MKITSKINKTNHGWSWILIVRDYQLLRGMLDDGLFYKTRKEARLAVNNFKTKMIKALKPEIVKIQKPFKLGDIIKIIGSN